MVCDEWHDIENFATWCEYSGYKEGMTIERIDVDGDYCPENCDDTKFMKGYNRYADSRHYDDYTPTVIEAEEDDR